jgi:hypothetical protein
VGVVAVDAASGDVVWGVTSAGLVQSGLEAALLSLAPSEVVALEPLGHDTARLLERFAGRGPGAAGGGGSGGGGGGGTGQCGRVSRLVRLPGGAYLSNAALARLSEFYAPSGDGGGGSGSDDGGSGADGVRGGGEGNSGPGAEPTGTTTAAAAVADGGGGGSGGGVGGGGALDFVLSLPPLVLQALSAAVEYLQGFGLAGVLRETSGFRPLAGAQGLVLSSNALRQLELLATSETEDGRRAQ